MLEYATARLIAEMASEIEQGRQAGLTRLVEQGWSGFPFDFLLWLCYNNTMLKMFTYRLFPTKKQVKKLNETLEECRWLYNHLLNMRKTAYERENISLTCFRNGLPSRRFIPRSFKTWPYGLIWLSKPSFVG